MQLYPSPALAPYILHYLILEDHVLQPSRHRFFPDGHPGIAFHFGDAFLQQDYLSKTPSKHPESFIYGQVNHHFDLISGTKIGMLIVVFKPFGLSGFMKMPAKLLANQTLALSEIFPNSAASLTDQVLSAANHPERIKRIESFLTSQLAGNPRDIRLVASSTNIIDNAAAPVSVRQLADDLAVSERSLERAFDQHIGISPKLYSRIARLQRYLKLRKTSPAMSLTALGYEAGYYDQAHFIKDFADLAGITPSQYDLSTNRLAVNLMQIK
ncbi:helix-turn-helix transcriptional regulator [Dyadobacter psychrophilus]|uniref:Helix-turn-helix domain-containing protein n=1 Tax=Dyadobacter psychrophilus TaxID=651661 RepID=A0A1T5EGC6_9BACT|nr:helix-turn-helix transcriptional regulator [Dyadobacter psychrophilus]SKB82835.1 Helix-turn-helix domain-containing protein [Dyadobacter psychrophilus]